MAAGQESERKTSGYDALDEPIGLRQLIADFTLPPPEDDPRLRAAILEQCRTGLMVLGMIWTIAPFVLLVGFTVISALHLAGPTPLPMREIYLLEAMLFTGGILILWFIRSPKRLIYARPLLAIDAAFFMAMLGRLEVYAGWSGFSTRMPTWP